MMARPTGLTRTCTSGEPRARLADARGFWDAADLLDDPDVRTTNAIHAAIAAADVICCLALGKRSSDGNHAAAVALLEQVDRKLAATLGRLLGLKAQASYEATNVPPSRASWSVAAAKRLVDAAEDRFLRRASGDGRSGGRR
jgi:hypothetical protein